MTKVAYRRPLHRSWEIALPLLDHNGDRRWPNNYRLMIRQPWDSRPRRKTACSIALNHVMSAPKWRGCDCNHCNWDCNCPERELPATPSSVAHELEGTDEIWSDTDLPPARTRDRGGS